MLLLSAFCDLVTVPSESPPWHGLDVLTIGSIESARSRARTSVPEDVVELHLPQPMNSVQARP